MFTLDQVVPWGRSFDEYRRMFALTEDDLRLRIVDCGGGPASFTASATRRGTAAVSCDPLYRWEAEEIRARIRLTSNGILEETRRNRDEFVWDSMMRIRRLRLRLSAA